MTSQSEPERVVGCYGNCGPFLEMAIYEEAPSAVDLFDTAFHSAWG